MAQIKKSDNSKCWWRCGETSDVSYVELWVMWRNEWCELCGVMSDVEKRVMWVMWSYEWCGEMSDVSYVELWVMSRNEWCEMKYVNVYSHVVQENVNGVAALENSLAVIINLNIKFPQDPEM